MRCALALGLAAAALGTGWTAPASAATDGDSLLIVDCLLPGQIRQLGGSVTFISARRAVKTSASDCEIRGGEYVKSDRASYATALKVWLPLAQQGKPDAQTYVGEIFEKGLGVPPDYQAAASWYRRAADQGFSRAEINLGSLYERGLGVPKDPAQALAWYRKAAGLPDLSFQAASPPVAAAHSAEDQARIKSQGAELEELRAEVESLKRRLSDKEGELRQTQDRLDRLKRSLQHSSRDADGQRAALDRLRQELADKRARDGESASDVKALEKAIAARESRLASKDKEIARLQASLAQMTKASSAQEAELRSLKRQSQKTDPSIQILEPELATARGGMRMAKLPESVEKLLVVGRVITPIGLASLSVNGREEKLDGEVFRTNFPVSEREEHVRVVAIDRNGHKSVVEFMIPKRETETASLAPAGPTAGATQRIGYPMPQPPIAFGSYYALVIGNNDYQHLPKLETAVADAEDVAHLLKDKYGYKVTLLLNGTRYQILSALNKLREKLTDQDNLLIYYGGHGELDQVNQRGNWLPVDAERDSSANWISNVAITDVLNAMTVRELLVVADSCYSGTLTRSALAHITGGISEKERMQLIREVAHDRSRMALTAGGIQPVLDSGGGKHSVFAQAFIEALKQNTGILAGQDLFQIVQAQVAAAARRADASQVPEYAPIKFAGHEAGDFFFVRTAAN